MTERLCRAQAGEPTSIEAREMSGRTPHSDAILHLVSRSNSVETRSGSCPPEDARPLPSPGCLVRSALRGHSLIQNP